MLQSSQQINDINFLQKTSHKNNTQNNNVQQHNKRQMRHIETNRNEHHQQTFCLPCKIHFQQKKKKVPLSCDALSTKVKGCPCIALSSFGEAT
jgi:hypothetical protein